MWSAPIPFIMCYERVDIIIIIIIIIIIVIIIFNCVIIIIIIIIIVTILRLRSSQNHTRTSRFVSCCALMIFFLSCNYYQAREWYYYKDRFDCVNHETTRTMISRWFCVPGVPAWSLYLFQTVPYLLFGRVNDYYLSVERNYYPWQQINYCRHPLCSLHKLLCSRIYIRLFFSFHPYVSFFIKSVHFTISIDKYLAATLKHLLTYRAHLYAFLKRTDLMARSSMNIFCIYIPFGRIVYHVLLVLR